MLRQHRHRPQRARRREDSSRHGASRTQLMGCLVPCTVALLLLCLTPAYGQVPALGGGQQPVNDQLTTGAPVLQQAVQPANQLGTQKPAVTVQNVPAAVAANRLGFTDRDTLPPNGGYAVYNFDTKEPGLGIPDVLLTVKASPASVALYCNPAWVTVEDENNKIAGPLNAIYQSESGGNIGNIYLSANNPIARPPPARIKGTRNYEDFTPAYNCTVINYDTDLPAHYTLSATFNFHDVKLNDQEQAAIRIIWNEVCRGRTLEADTQILTATDGLLDPKLRNLTCGQWVSINEANAAKPYTDFCNVVGNACNAQGQLTQFNMNGWNLGGNFPVDQLARFRALSEIDISNNPNMRADLKKMFDAFAQLQNLQVVELTGNAGMSGTFGYEATPENNQNTALCKTVQGGLRILNMNGLGLAGLALPDCLMGKTSTLEELRLANNGLVGTLPDVYDDTSPLQYLSLRNNKLTGTIPVTLGKAGDLQTLDLAGNNLRGDIPRNIGEPRRLRFLHLGFNQLSGSVPSGIALHDRLEALDLRNNRLDTIPPEWTNAPNTIVAQTPLVYLRIAGNQFTANFPTTFARLPKLAVLDMKNNKFKGELPNIRGMFSALRYFDISSNVVGGFIPQAWADTGIIRLKPTEAALINQFEQTTGGAPVETAGSVTFQQVFNISSNQIQGLPPIWMFADNVPSWAEGGIDIRSNKLTINCAGKLPVQLAYLGKERACPQAPTSFALATVTGSNAADQGAAAPLGAAPLISPAVAPAVVQAVEVPSEAEAPASFDTSDNTVVTSEDLGSNVNKTVSGTTDSSSGSTDSGGGGGGLPAWAKAVISIAVILVVVLAAALAFVLLRRGSGHGRGFLTRARPSGFSKFIDAADAESGKGAFGNVQMGARGAENGAANGDHGNGYGFSNGASTNGNGFISNMHHR